MSSYNCNLASKLRHLQRHSKNEIISSHSSSKFFDFLWAISRRTFSNQNELSENYMTLELSHLWAHSTTVFCFVLFLFVCFTFLSLQRGETCLISLPLILVALVSIKINRVWWK